MRQQRILLVDGSQLLREVLKRVFERSPDILVVGEMVDVQNLPHMLRTTRPDWLVVSLPPKNKLPDEMQQTILKELPLVQVMYVSSDGSEVWIESRGKLERGYRGLTLAGLKDLFQTGPDGAENEKH